MSLSYLALHGSEVANYRAELAALRIEVFRTFPYLYEGSVAYEESYLQRYIDCSDSFILLVCDGKRVVGATTALPLVAADDEFQGAFKSSGLATHDVLYLGESVLLPGYRGQGVGHRFFDERETHAARLRLPHTAFCAVVRSDDHPLRPLDYRPLDAFWRARGYEPREGLRCSFSWKDLDHPQATCHEMQFWLRSIAG